MSERTRTLREIAEDIETMQIDLECDCNVCEDNRASYASDLRHYAAELAELRAEVENLSTEVVEVIYSKGKIVDENDVLRAANARLAAVVAYLSKGLTDFDLALVYSAVDNKLKREAAEAAKETR